MRRRSHLRVLRAFRRQRRPSMQDEEGHRYPSNGQPGPVAKRISLPDHLGVLRLASL